jgi:hypothetical protein
MGALALKMQSLKPGVLRARFDANGPNVQEASDFAFMYGTVAVAQH